MLDDLIAIRQGVGNQLEKLDDIYTAALDIPCALATRDQLALGYQSLEQVLCHIESACKLEEAESDG
ncbi:MAG: hypothetical protein V3V32_04595 [Dehalococcoidia bacterium]